MGKHLRKQTDRLAMRQAIYTKRLNDSRSGIPKPPMEGHVRNQYQSGGMTRPGSMNPKKG